MKRAIYTNDKFNLTTQEQEAALTAAGIPLDSSQWDDAMMAKAEEVLQAAVDAKTGNRADTAEYVGYVDGKEYDVLKVSPTDPTVGYCAVEGMTSPQWCSFDRIEKKQRADTGNYARMTYQGGSNEITFQDTATITQALGVLATQGLNYESDGYLTVTFQSPDDASKAFKILQGKLRVSEGDLSDGVLVVNIAHPEWGTWKVSEAGGGQWTVTGASGTKALLNPEEWEIKRSVTPMGAQREVWRSITRAREIQAQMQRQRGR